MTEISLTDFVDFVSKSGTSRLAKVRELKRRPEYHPKMDYYRVVRDSIREAHEHGGHVVDVEQILAHVANSSKRTHYKTVLLGYQEFLKRRDVEFFEPPYKKRQQSDLSIRINPELGLVLDGIPHVIKLYFKPEPLSKSKSELITHTMETSLRKKAPEGAVMSVLDTRRGKLFLPSVPISGLDALLASEAIAFLHLWQEL